MKQDLMVGPRGQVVAERIHGLRESADMTYAEVSRRTGGALAYLALKNIESGNRRIDVDELFALAAALDSNVATLLGGENAVLHMAGSLAPEDLERSRAEFAEWQALPNDARAELERAERTEMERDTGMSDSEHYARRRLEFLVNAAPAEVVGELLAIVRRIVPE